MSSEPNESTAKVQRATHLIERETRASIKNSAMISMKTQTSSIISGLMTSKSVIERTKKTSLKL